MLLIKTYFDIFIVFFKAGLYGFGGGSALIPVMKDEIVDVRKWMTMDEFSNIIAVAHALPGVSATKIAAYIGYKMGGIPGFLFAILGLIVPGVAMMIFLYSLIIKYQSNKYMEKILFGLKFIIAGMLATSVMYVVPSIKTFDPKYLIGMIFAAAVFIAIYVLDINPLYIILISIILSLIIF